MPSTAPPPNGSYVPAMPPEVRRSGADTYDAGRVPPSATDAEAAMLGVLLVDPSYLPRVRAVLPDPAALYDARNRHIYEAMLALVDAGRPVDLVTTNQWLTERDRAGAGYYVASLLSSANRVANAETYAYVVREAALKRDLIRSTASLLARAYDPTTDAFDLLEEGRAGVDSISKGLPGHALVPSSIAVPDAVGDILREVDEGIVPGVPTGFPGVDRMLNGLRPGRLYCVAGRPGMGKSMLGLSIAHRVAKAGHTVALFSLEMSTAENIARLVAAEADVDGSAIERRRLMPEERRRVEDARDTLAALPIHYDDTAGITPEEVRAKLHRFSATAPVDVVVVDYLQLMRGQGKSRNEEVGYCSRQLKSIAKEYGCAVIVAAQINRGVENRPNKRPDLADLRDSGEIEQDCDVVAFLYRPEYYGITHEESGTDEGATAFDVRGLCEVLIRKNRQGDADRAWLRFDGSRTRFLDMTERIADRIEAPTPF